MPHELGIFLEQRTGERNYCGARRHAINDAKVNRIVDRYQCGCDPYDRGGGSVFEGALAVVARERAHPTSDKQKYPADTSAPDILENRFGKPWHIPFI